MNRSLIVKLIVLLSFVSVADLAAQGSTGIGDDPFIWLEEVEGSAALEWVNAHNSTTMAEFANDSNFIRFQNEALTILNSKHRIPFGTFTGGYVYNFWQDDSNAKGLLRRTTLDEYTRRNPKWEILLDIDKLNAKEGKNWVYKGAVTLPPDNSRCMIALSSGGQDAVYYREFDYDQKSFVADGFNLPEAKSMVAWYDENTLVVGTDFGPGTLTSSGYPRILKLWKRGTPLAQAKAIMEGDISDVDVSGQVEFRPEAKYLFLYRSVSFWQTKKWLVDENLNKIELPFPADAEVAAVFKNRLIVHLNSDWLSFKEGALLAVKTIDLQSDNIVPKVEIIYEPDSISTISGIAAIKEYIIVSILQNVRGKALCFEVSDSSGGVSKWSHWEMKLPDSGSIHIMSTDAFNNVVMMTFEDFTTPTKLYLFSDPKAKPREIKSLPEMFDSGDLKTSQLTAKSKDGTIIPYFLISSKHLDSNGLNPTLLYGYGGFRATETPRYSAILGKLWLENGGTYALPNIRGGSEFGPKWHKAALLGNRQKAFDDFIAVAEDLIRRKITSPKYLGIMGGSNGGLLMGAAFTQRPDLFNAVVCQVPLLDMLRYTKLPPGASWIGEYGDPDSPGMRPYIEKYSPYQNLKNGVAYPQVLFVTSTRDDRVHPGHARKMAAKMEQMGNKIYYLEEMTGGHSAAADNIQRARRQALEYSYLSKMLRLRYYER
ncbi:MAG: S9 family peptidase [candidate division Zixibacteria bacterium CG_4_9_14_3_um_filter_46_8]|nr:MAG: S9 family peptidase [candidate division Zixibacteria bacterium CG_4_9_14_3_um_filter_46_8]